MTPELLLNLTSNLGAVGFILWLAHRLTTVTIPRMTESFTAATQKQREDFRHALDAQREDFVAACERESERSAERLKAVMDKCLAGRGEA